MRHMASFSGGKDSTAMVLLLLEHGWPLDEIVFFDTGWEFPQMLEHIEMFKDRIDVKFTTLRPKYPFTESLITRPIVARKGPNKGKVYRMGNGWPSPMRRWCTREKVRTIDKHCKGAVQYIGFADDEAHRANGASISKKDNVRFPLIKMGVTEADALKICYDEGYTFGGLYEHFKRVSCYCCPLQSLRDLRTMRSEFPELWSRMLAWDEEIADNKGFRGYERLGSVDRKLAFEDSCMLPFMKKSSEIEGCAE